VKKVLIINASARMHSSRSRELTEMFADHWKSIHDNPAIRFRELGNADIPHIKAAWITANIKADSARTEEDLEALRISDGYIAELKQADIIVLGTPMYNWSIPSALKAYIDQVMRLDVTFRLNPGNTEQPYIGLLENKILFLLVARGSQGYEPGEVNAHLNFQSTYLKTVFNMMGIHDIHQVVSDGTTAVYQKVKDLIEQELIELT
jgi:FMN-dependent NADH-azoreductase